MSGRDDEDDRTPRSPYDDAEADDVPAPTPIGPLMGGLAGGAGPAGWIAAEARAARALAETAAALARLDEALRRGPAGFPRRLAILEATALARADGLALRAEHVALFAAGAGAGAPAEDGGAGRAAWAAGRLLAEGPAPTDAEAARAFLGRVGPGAASATLAALLGRAEGEADDAWEAARVGLRAAHPLTRAAATLALWPRGSRGDLLEPALLAARIAAGGLRALTFAPLALAAGRALARVRSAHDLGGFLDAAREGAEQARLGLERIEAWRARAAGEGGPSGPARRRAALADHLAASPAVSASMAAAALGVSVRTAERLMAAAEAEGLVREITGQARWRFWAARA